MLKKRIGAAIIIRNGIVVQSIGFNKYLPIGRPEIAVEYLNKWGIDEIIIIDISATQNKISIDSSMIRRSAKKCFVPLAVGGGITSLEQVETLMSSGADKIVLNNVLFNKPKFATEVALKYGDQCVVGCIDVKYNEAIPEVYNYSTKSYEGVSPIERAKYLQSLGVGEILINLVDRDGSYTGFDIEILDHISDAVSVPVIALGGAGKAVDFIEVLQKTKVSAACAGNIFHFTEHSVIAMKSILINAGLTLRMETHARYDNASFTDNARLLKKNDNLLEKLLFKKIEKEII